jgi:uncharacterized protein
MPSDTPATLDPRYLSGEFWGKPKAVVEHIETHAAHVFLCGDQAFKIKKPVKLPYLDFSTAALRRTVLEHELALNRRLAPDLYQRVVSRDGEPVLVMKRFESEALLSRHVEHGGVADALAASLAQAIAHSHELAEPSARSGSANMAGLEDQLAKAFAASPDLFPPAQVRDFDLRYHETRARLDNLLEDRSARGLVRRCHGDLHCGNIVILNNTPVLFDAIEFSEELATVDVLYDLAFLIMDLLRRGQKRAANIVLNKYLQLRRKQEDFSGLAALPLFLATRAGVRALVTADLAHGMTDARAGSRQTAREYFDCALRDLETRPAELLCIGGLSGTGKSTLARSLAPLLGAPPGALHLRSDVERKLLAGVAETERLPDACYGPEQSQRVHEAILARAGRGLAAGHSVVIDAVFSKPEERRGVEELARQCCVHFRGLWLEARPEILIERVASRRGDASDATPEVIARQLLYELGPLTWPRLDVSGSRDHVFAQACSVMHEVIEPPRSSLAS